VGIDRATLSRYANKWRTRANAARARRRGCGVGSSRYGPPALSLPNTSYALSIKHFLPDGFQTHVTGSAPTARLSETM